LNIFIKSIHLTGFLIFHRYPSLRILSLLMLSLCLSACMTSAPQKIAVQEFMPFNVMPAHHRIMNQVRISWEVREDVSHFCGFAARMGRDRSYLTPPLGCAIWDILKAECTIVTGPLTSHVALGHELRHCFEGHYHR
jgi:hypothetical protein